MSNQKEIEKMRENILNGNKNFIGISPNYCDSQNYCKIVNRITNQYNKVVQQNKDLQKENQWLKQQMNTDNQYVIKLEEANMLFEKDVEILKRQIEELKKEIYKNEN